METKLSPAGAGDEFGSSAALSGDGMVAIVGASLDDAAGSDAGTAFMYRFVGRGAAWGSATEVTVDDAGAGENFGAALATSGDRLVVSRHLRDFAGTDSGTVAVFAGLSLRDENANGIPDGCDVFGDANGNGNTHLDDLLMVLSGWGQCPASPALCPADLSGDRMVNVDDLLIVINGWTM